MIEGWKGVKGVTSSWEGRGKGGNEMLIEVNGGGGGLVCEGKRVERTRRKTRTRRMKKIRETKENKVKRRYLLLINYEEVRLCRKCDRKR